MSPYFLFKDLITIFVFLLVYSSIVFFNPNMLGDSENYIEGNPLVTPAAIKIMVLLIINLLSETYYSFYNKKIINNLEYKLNKNFIINHLKNDVNIEKINKEEFRKFTNGIFQAEGHIGCEIMPVSKINNKQLLIKPIIRISLNYNIDNIEFFKILNKILDNKLKYNIFKLSSGNWHIVITTKNWEIVINKILPYLNNLYGDKARGALILIKLKYIYDSLNKVEKFSEEWLRRHIKMIYLIYNMVDNNQRELDLESYIQKFINKISLQTSLRSKGFNYNKHIKICNDKDYYINYINTILENRHYNKHFKPNKLFILGFFVGDGSFKLNIYEPDKSILPWYKSSLIIYQKNTINNNELLKILSKYMNKYNIKSYVSLANNNKTKDYYVKIYIEDKTSMQIIGKYITNYKYLFFAKRNMLELLINYIHVCKYVKFWRLANIIIINSIKRYHINNFNINPNSINYNYYSLEELINKYEFITKNSKDLLDNSLLYKINNNNIKKYKFPNYLQEDTIKLCFSNYYEEKINNNFDFYKNNKNIPYCFIYKNINKKEFYVKLPFNTKPKIKYFSINKNITDENCINLCIEYRNNKIKEWLKNNNYIEYIKF